MKKSKLKAKIAELEKSVHIWKAAFLEASKELNRVNLELYDLFKAQQCGNNVLATVAGQPSVTVTATREEDSPLAKMATLALRMGWPLEPTQADREALYRDGLARGLTSVEAFERAKMGEKAWDDLAGKLFDEMPVTPDGVGRSPDYMRKVEVPVAAMATQALRVAEGDMAGKLAEFLVNSKPSLADKDGLYRDGLAAGFTSEDAWERAKMGVEAWNAKRRAEFEKDAAE